MKPAITKMKEWLEDYGQTHSHDCPDNLTNVLIKARSLEAEEQAQGNACCFASDDFTVCNRTTPRCEHQYNCRAETPSPLYLMEHEKQLKSALAYCEDMAKQNDILKQKLTISDEQFKANWKDKPTAPASLKGKCNDK